MTQPPNDMSSLEQIHLFVHAVLCEKENLLEDQFLTHVSILKRGGRACGIQFSLYGPRSVRLEAVWAADRNLIYFYDAIGSRYRKVALRNRIAIPEAV